MIHTEVAVVGMLATFALGLAVAYLDTLLLILRKRRVRFDPQNRERIGLD